MNHVALTGRLVRDLKLHKTATGKPFTFFTVAVSSSQDKTDYIPCVAWTKVAENMANYLVKGSLISISGRISTRKSTYEGKDQYITEVVALVVNFLDNRKKELMNNDSNTNYVQPISENKINLDEAFKTPNYNTNINFIDSSNPAVISNADADTTFDEDEAIIWDN